MYKFMASAFGSQHLSRFNLSRWRRIDEVEVQNGVLSLFLCAEFASGILNLYLDVKIWLLPQELFCLIG